MVRSSTDGAPSLIPIVEPPIGSPAAASANARSIAAKFEGGRVVGGWRGRHRSHRRRSCGERVECRPGVASTPIVAVIPFTNLSPEAESDLFVDGLTDEVIRNLAVIEGLQVRSRTSSFAFKDKPRNLRDVGEQLGATLVVEGSVLGSGTRKRINVQLVQVGSDVTLWAGPVRPGPQVLERRLRHPRRDLARHRQQASLDARARAAALRPRHGHLRAVPEGPRARGPARNPQSRKSPRICSSRSSRGIRRSPRRTRASPTPTRSCPSPTSSRLPFDVAHPVLRAAAVKARELDPLLAEAHAGMGWVYLARARLGERREVLPAGDPAEPEPHPDLYQLLHLHAAAAGEVRSRPWRSFGSHCETIRCRSKCCGRSAPCSCTPGRYGRRSTRFNGWSRLTESFHSPSCISDER